MKDGLGVGSSLDGHFGNVRRLVAGKVTGPFLFSIVGELVDGHPEARPVRTGVVSLHLQQNGLELGVASIELGAGLVRLFVFCDEVEKLLVTVGDLATDKLSA